MTDIASLGFDIDSGPLAAVVAKLREVAEAAGRAAEGAKDFGKKMDSMGRSISGFGKSWSLYVTAPLTGFGGLALHTAGQFELAMNNVAAISGAVGDQLGRLEAQAKDLGATTQFSASQAADAMGFLAMAGFDAEQIMGAMPGTLQLAAAAQMDLAQAADITSNVLTGYNKTVEELGHVNDVLVKAFTSANTNLQQLGEAMKYAGPIASAAGMSFEEAAAAISLMGNAGIQGSMAGTSLRGALTRILNPTKQVYDAMAEASLSFTDASGRLLDLDQIIEQLAPHIDDAGLFMRLFGQRAGPAMAALVAQGSDALVELRDELEGAGGTAERIASVQMQGFSGAMKELRSAFEALQIAVAQSGLLEFATELASKVADLLRWVADVNPEILKWGTIIGGVALAMGPLLVAVGSLSIALGALAPLFAAVGAGLAVLTGPIGILVAAVVGLTAAWVAWGDDIVEIVESTVSWVKNAFSDFVDNVVAIFSNMGDLIVEAFSRPFKRITDLTESVTAKITDIWASLSNVLVGNSIIPDMNEAIEADFARSHVVVVDQARATAKELEAVYADLARVQSELMPQTEEEAKQARFDEQMAVLKEALELEAITRAEYREYERMAIEEFDAWREEQRQGVIEREMADMQRVADEESRLMQQRLSGWSGFFGNLATITAAGGKRTFALFKAFAVAQAVIDAISAAQGAYKVGASIGGPPLGAAFAAAAMGAQMARLAQIKATDYTGTSASNAGTRGGSVGAAAAPVAPAAPSPRDVTIRLEGGRTLFSREDLGQILEGLNDLAGDGARYRIA